MDRAGSRRREAATALREMLDRIAAATESVLEDDFLALVRRYGLPEPDRQWPIAGGAFRLDFAWHDAWWEDVHEWGADTMAALGALLRQGRAAA